MAKRKQVKKQLSEWEKMMLKMCMDRPGMYQKIIDKSCELATHDTIKKIEEWCDEHMIVTEKGIDTPKFETIKQFLKSL